MDNKNIITVGQGENYDCNSITDALKTAEYGSKIFINGGVYNEVLYINKQVELTGDPDNIPVVQNESGLVCSVNSKSVISNIHFNNTSTKEIDKSKNDNAEPVIENCNFDEEYDQDDCLADMYLAMTSGDGA